MSTSLCDESELRRLVSNRWTPSERLLGGLSKRTLVVNVPYSSTELCSSIVKWRNESSELLVDIFSAVILPSRFWLANTRHLVQSSEAVIETRIGNCFQTKSTKLFEHLVMPRLRSILYIEHTGSKRWDYKRASHFIFLNFRSRVSDKPSQMGSRFSFPHHGRLLFEGSHCVASLMQFQITVCNRCDRLMTAFPRQHTVSKYSRYIIMVLE